MTGEKSGASRLRRLRLRRAEMRLADVEHYYWQWITPHKWRGTSPSEDARWQKKIERARRRVVALGGEVDA